MRPVDAAISDVPLVRQVLGGQVGAYGILASRWAPSVMATCHDRVRRTDVAEDMTQEALLRGLRALPSLQDPEKFGPWLRGIAVRTCLDWLKASARGEVPISELPAERGQSLADGPADLSDACEKSEEIDRLMRQVDLLPPPHRKVLLHYYYQDCTYKQIAEQLGVSVATVNARLTQARQMLRQQLAVESHDEL